MGIKSKTADIIYQKMLMTTPRDVAQVTIAAMDRIQDEKVPNQLLGLAASLICLLEQYELDYSDVLGMAHNYVYSGDGNNMIPEFKAVKNFMKEEWEL